jgi:thiamine phosphate synthase YjbQ (UPF0047 family)
VTDEVSHGVSDLPDQAAPGVHQHPVTNGKLDFGPWQQVYYAEFDGQRSKRVLIKVIGE